MRCMLPHGLLIVLSLVLLSAGCATQVPVSPAASGSETTSVSPTPVGTLRENQEELAVRRDRALQATIEERERRVVEESMRRRFGEPTQTAPTMQMSSQALVHQDVHFAYDSFTLSQEAQAVLEQKAAWLSEHTGTTIQIEGHCDERGTTAYNLALGERRAHAVKQYLAAFGINASRLSAVSYGEEFPLDPGHDEAAWGHNRRAHFVVTNQ